MVIEKNKQMKSINSMKSKYVFKVISNGVEL